MITIFAGLATFERHLIKARTDEGRKRAQARGVRFGRPLKLTRYQIEEALARREALAGNQRTMPVINGSVTRVSADITREQQNSNQPAQAYYTESISADGSMVTLNWSGGLEPISKSFEEDNEAGKLDKAEEIVGLLLPTNEDPALPLNSGEEALDEPASHVAA